MFHLCSRATLSMNVRDFFEFQRTFQLGLFKELSQRTTDEVLLATDLHAANVLQAQRVPWLVIDPKPFVGDRAYDATQHLLNCDERLQADPAGTVGRFAEMLELECERVRLWTFARVAVDSRAETMRPDSLARLLVP
jgi:streptomycin 6-kinase